MKPLHLFAGFALLALVLISGCYFQEVQRSTYAVTPDGQIYEVDPYYNDMVGWVGCDVGQRDRIHTILIETRNQVIIDRRNCATDREFNSLARQRYNNAYSRIGTILTPDQFSRFKPHRTEFRNWVYGQRERPQQNRDNNQNQRGNDNQRGRGGNDQQDHGNHNGHGGRDH